MEHPQKPGSSPVVKVLAIIGIAFLLLCLTLVGTCAYCLMSNPAVRQAGSVFGETMKMGMAAANAPGTAELRVAGCDEAAVMDMRALIAALERMEKNGAKAKMQLPEAEWQKTLVLCQYHTADRVPLTCEAVAATYGKAVPTAPPQFGVAVRRMTGPGQGEELCRGIHDPTGAKVGEIPADMQPGRVHIGAEPDDVPGEFVPMPEAPDAPAPGPAMPPAPATP